MKLPRQCCRPGCARSAVATLTFVYAESTAVIGPLATTDEPHSWDLCDEHARRITVPRGWEMLRSESGFSAPVAEDYELTALAEAVREAGAVVGGGRERYVADSFDDLDDLPPGRHRAGAPAGRFTDRPSGADDSSRHRSTPVKPRPGRRGHLRVLPDPVD
ncbi:DUF3499 domain-containing protein [Gordonia soli]|uniref:DUF3499 domain-containing protein n=1 Tax=Gordonia soli TaxID=320799 RepID=UPI00034A6CE3|nr:DUF3499 domain-containing protein [Gordonia soli]